MRLRANCEQGSNMFLKYPSLINHTQEKDIQWWLDNYPHLQDATYIAREKFDGANISVLIMPDGSIKVGRRTDWLVEDEKFYDVYGALEKASALIDCFKERAMRNSQHIRLFFELHGRGINKRVYYCEDVVLTLLDVVIDDQWQTPQGLLITLSVDPLLANECEIYQNSILGTYQNINDALAASCDFNSTYCDKSDNPAEGIVIRPWEFNLFNHRGERFVIKKKAESFSENKARLKVYEVQEQTEHQKAFLEYINDNRVLSVFSKHGPITSQRMIGDYIKLVMDDAKEDFHKDYPNADMTDRDVFKAGGNRIVPLLRKHIVSY